jgi:hypothetical protein
VSKQTANFLEIDRSYDSGMLLLSFSILPWMFQESISCHLNFLCLIMVLCCFFLLVFCWRRDETVCFRSNRCHAG